jgi:uncharacterized membrane protein YhiD involved in acid resistance
VPEWLKSLMDGGTSVPPSVLALRLAVAFGFGCVIAGIYRLARRHDSTSPTFHSTLVILSILCAMLPQVIGENVARAFSLVGALSIVRFRTVVDDTQDIAFVIFAVLVGMAIGANHWPVALVGTVVVGIAALVVQPRRSTNRWSDIDSTLTVRVGVGRNPEEILQGVLAKHVERSDLVSGATGRQGAALDLTYKIRLRAASGAAELIDELNRIEGVQSVELRRS